MAGAAITINFKDGKKFTKDQKHRLGIVVPDELGDLWTYVQLREAMVYGQVCADFQKVGTLSAAASKGTRYLKDTGEFGGTADKWLKGAIGWIPSARVAFYIKKWVDANTLQIESLADNTGIDRGGWLQNIPNSVLYNLIMPGLVVKGSATGITRGVVQAKYGGQAGEFGFIKQTRWGGLLVAHNNQDVRKGHGMVPVAKGIAGGFAPTPTGLNALRRVARHAFETIDVSAVFGSSAKVVWADLTVDNKMVSYSFSDDEHAINQVVIA